MHQMAAVKPASRRSAFAMTLVAALGAASLIAATPAAAQTNVDCGRQNLQTAINNAHDGATLAVHGTCVGTFFINDKSLHLVGVGGAVLDAREQGTTVLIAGRENDRVTISHLTLAGGWPGLFNGGSNTTVSDVTVRNNPGGGIDNFHGTMRVTEATVRDNSAVWGAGIQNWSGTLSVTNSTVHHNTALSTGGGGGGIANVLEGRLRLDNVTVHDNTSAGVGGGLWQQNGGTTLLTRSTVRRNSARNGGGIFNTSGTVTLQRSQVIANSPNNCVGAVPGCSG